MNLFEMIELTRKCEELEKRYEEALEVLKLYQHTCPDGGTSVSQYSPAAEFLAKVEGK